MPSLSLLIPSLKTLRRAIPNASTVSPSIGPSLMSWCRDMLRYRGLIPIMLRFVAAMAFRWWWFVASLLDRPRCGDLFTFMAEEVLASRRVGEMLRWVSRCCAIKEGCRGGICCRAALEPRLCADCSLRKARCVRGEGGGSSSVVFACDCTKACGAGGPVNGSLVGLDGMFANGRGICGIR